MRVADSGLGVSERVMIDTVVWFLVAVIALEWITAANSPLSVFK
jgi:hypothetical protein